MLSPLFALSLTLLACGDKDGDDTATTPGDDTGTPGTTPNTEPCDDGLARRTWTDAEDSEALFATAADLTIETDVGDVVLSEIWDGCDVFLFLQDEPAQADADQWPKHLWERDVDDLFAALPPNTVLFLGSNENTEDARAEALELMWDEVDDVLDDMSDEDRAWWESRIYWIDGRYQSQDGWLGDTIDNPGWGTVLDRNQQIRYVGSYADPGRYLSSAGWFEPNVSMAANEAVYANYLAQRDARLAADGATVVTVWDETVMADPHWAGTRTYVDVELPDAATMAGFDTLEFDLTMNCDGDGEYGTCPAWDYLVYLYLCDEDDPDSCNTEFGRWITTYHRAGRFVHDASALLPLIQSGGTRRLAFYTTQTYVISLDLRLSNQGKETRPTQATWLFGGGAFDVNYNSLFEPVEVEIPAGATKVELATVISGHGQVSPGTCAEFCNTEHHFYVNGTDNVRELDNAGTEFGCMDMVDEGVIPNQYGTWWYGRSGWCPGWQVPVVTIDVTDQVTPGQVATFDYEGFRNGEPYETGGANIVMSSWVVSHE
ncbi:hypothetical protein L6R53_20135 [Myxococcota bacterium]|nr:hypothetical protein [Myxococcota bacterium]